MEKSTVESVLRRIVRIREGETAALLLSAAYFFCLMSGYYILRPLRDAMGLEGGVRNLPWLYLSTLGAMLVANPIFASLVSRWPRRKFIPVTYRFFIVNLLVFFVLLKVVPETGTVHVARAFFVWVSVFNLYAVSILWGFMADLWNSGQGKRLFGFIGAGGTLGSIVGAFVTASLAETIGPVYLLLISAVLLEGGVQAVRRLVRIFGPELGSAAPTVREPSRGTALDGIRLVFSSAYLAGICLYMFLYTLTSTFLYFEQAHIVDASFQGLATRTAFFAKVDFLVNVLTLGVQLFLTGRILSRLGVALTLAVLPVLTVAGFTGLGVAPLLGILVTFQVLRRATNYALARPAREVLYTVLGRDEKYKAKSFVDTFVYRGGDAVGAWGFGHLTALGVGLAGMAFLAVPIAVVWAGVALLLGFKQARLEAAGL